jgi:hypothetical protein
MKLKLQYLKKFYQFNPLLDPSNPRILTYAYWEQIRPRGELLRAKGIAFDWKEVLKLSNEEFLAKFEISQEVFPIF